MTTRTFRQLGIAFGAAPATIIAKINDVIVYQGPVTTLNEPVPALPNPGYTVDNVLFTWTNDVTYEGPVKVEIQVDADSDILVAEIDANYTPIPNPAYVDANTTPTVSTVMSSGPDGFIDLPASQIGDVYVQGELQTIDHTNLPGQWWWELTIPDDIVINATITPGLE
jgi:hypothetical protein